MASSPTLSRRHFLVLPAALLPVSMASAQATPTGSPAALPAASMKVAAMLQDLPGVLSDAHLRRYTLDPQASIPSGTMGGSAVLLVRAGNMTLTGDLAAIYRRAGETGPATMTDIPPDGLAMVAGEGVLVPDTASMTLTNTGSDVANIAILLISSGATATGDGHTPTTGVTEWGLGAAALPFQEGPAITIVEQVMMQPGRSGYSSTLRGVEIGALERGEARVLCQAGNTRIMPGSSGSPLTTDPVEVGTSVELASGDGYTSTDGSLLWRATGDEPLVILRAQVIPVPQPGQ